MSSSPEAMSVVQPLQGPEGTSTLARAMRVALKAKRGAFAAGAWGLQDLGGWSPCPGDLEDGLMLWVDGQCWRILERLAFSLEFEGQAQPLIATGVESTPTRACWRLEAAGILLHFELSMADGGADFSTSAWRAQWHVAQAPGVVELVVRPHLDMRAPQENPDAARHRVHPHDGQRLSVVHSNRWAAFGWEQAVAYQAERRVVGEGMAHQRMALHAFPSLPAPKVLVPGAWRMALNQGQSSSLWVTAAHGQKQAIDALNACLAEGQNWQDADEAKDADLMAELAPLPGPAAQRAVALLRHLAHPEAADGAPATAGWGAIPVLSRSWLEGWWHNQKTWQRMGKAAALTAVVDHALDLLEAKQGRFSRWLDGQVRGEAPPAGDAEAMFFALAGELVGDAHADETRQMRLGKAAWAFVTRTMESRLTTRFGDPVLLESGLLAMLPGASWMDALHDVQVEGRTVLDLPARVPEAWVREAASKVKDAHYLWEQLQYPNALFPEANAWWLRALAAMKPWVAKAWGAAELAEIQAIESAARASFGPCFWNAHQGSLYNLVTTERKHDGTPSAGAVMAAALVPDGVLERAQLERTWLAARDRLLVSRVVGAQALPLALLARDAGSRSFTSPAQAHGAVAHSSCTPYLFALLRRLGQDATARDVLVANLHAQVHEGVPFMQPEAFGWPHASEDLLPLGAPAAWAAQWCDPFLDMAPAVEASWASV